MPRKQSPGELLMAEQLRQAGIKAEAEYEFWPGRKWRADFRVLTRPLLIEVEGGSWVNGAHNRGKAFALDCEKYAFAAIAGYRLIRVTTEQVNDGSALHWVRLALEERP